MWKQPEIIEWATQKTRIIFHYTGSLIGLPKMVNTKPYNKGEYNHQKNNLNNQGALFLIAQINLTKNKSPGAGQVITPYWIDSNTCQKIQNNQFYMDVKPFQPEESIDFEGWSKPRLVHDF